MEDYSLSKLFGQVGPALAERRVRSLAFPSRLRAAGALHPLLGLAPRPQVVVDVVVVEIVEAVVTTTMVEEAVDVLRKTSIEKKTFSFGHCPNEGRGVYPCPDFLAPFFAK